MKNTHLEHIEEEVFSNGLRGIKKTVDTLESLFEMLSGNSRKSVKITIKWDGAPSIVCGIDPESGKFFVGTKSVFNREPKLNFTPADIDKNHPDSGLNAKLKVALKYLPEIGITGVLQGDMLYTQDDLKTESFDGESCISFTPNTITYAIPKDSVLGNIITSSKMGIVFHTAYTGSKITDLIANFSPNLKSLKMTKNVWFRDADYTDVSGAATFNAVESSEIRRELAKLEQFAKKIPAKIINEVAVNNELNSAIKKQNNKYVRMGQKVTNPRRFIQDLSKSVEEKYNEEILKLKTEVGKQNKAKGRDKALATINLNIGGLIALVDFIACATEVKTKIIHKLSKMNKTKTFMRTDGGYKVTNPEGFVVIDNDGSAVKLVDRLEFSKNNFNLEKNWTK